MYTRDSLFPTLSLYGGSLTSLSGAERPRWRRYSLVATMLSVRHRVSFWHRRLLGGPSWPHTVTLSHGCSQSLPLNSHIRPIRSPYLLSSLFGLSSTFLDSLLYVRVGRHTVFRLFSTSFRPRPIVGPRVRSELRKNDRDCYSSKLQRAIFRSRNEKRKYAIPRSHRRACAITRKRRERCSKSYRKQNVCRRRATHDAFHVFTSFRFLSQKITSTKISGRKAIAIFRWMLPNHDPFHNVK